MKASQVITLTNEKSVTPEQIGACHKCYDCTTRANFYLVENSKGETDENGDIIEYKVQYSKEHGFTCDCKAGQNGLLCWHIRASIACAREEKAALAEQVALNDGVLRDAGMLAWLEDRKAGRDINLGRPSWMMR
jgi:hypothetical protein